VRAAIYARYSSENQRPESIEDQVASCRRLAKTRGFGVREEHIYTDLAASGAREDRAGPTAMRHAGAAAAFDVVLVDDLSRLARNTLLLLSLLEELRFHGVRVVSVADGLDSDDEEAAVGERRTERSALLLRKLLGRIRLEPVKPDVGRPYYRAVSKLQPLALLEIDTSSEGSEECSNPLRWWRRRESNPRPKTRRREALQA
jgi:hypothetical protein